MVEIFGIQFAPLSVTLDRRLQTFAVSQFISLVLLYGFVGIFINYYLIFYTRFWWVSLVYMIWYIVDQPVVHRGGRRHLLTLGDYLG